MALNYLDNKTLDDCFEDKHVLVELHDGNQSVEFKISNPKDIAFLREYCLAHSSDLQSLFSVGEYSYLSCFTDPKEKMFQEKLAEWKDDYPEMWGLWVSGAVNEVMISFPEK